MKIFLIEDDLTLAHLVCQTIEKYNFDVTIATNFQYLDQEFFELKPDLVLMDINLPYFDGFYWTKKIRQQSNVPIIFLSAREHPMDQVMAMEYGGDDYLVKPFNNDILIAKIKSHLRRSYGEYAMAKERTVSFQALTYYPERLEIHYQANTELLTKKEGELLELLIEEAPKVVPREMLLMTLWDDIRFVDDNTLSVNMGRLRKKLEDIGLSDCILTIRSKGYQLNWQVD